MKNSLPPEDFRKTLSLPYQAGVFLAANAVPDCCAVIDGLNCVMAKIDFLAGNHDIHSTLLSPSGDHRVICTMSGPLPQKDNPDKPLAALLAGISGSGRYGAVLLTGLPFQKLAGMDYEGLAAAGAAGAPLCAVAPSSLDADWLEAYDLSLDALARAMPARRGRLRRRAAAVVGYLHDRGEGDHAANIRELRRLLEAAGLEPVCIMPSGVPYRDLCRAMEAGVVISLPYGRRAARTVAARSGARLVETGLPMGFTATTSWLLAAREAAGLRGPLPAAVAAARRAAAAAASPLLDALAHRNAVFAGDPWLCEGFCSLASDLRLRVPLALLTSRHRRMSTSVTPASVLFSPDIPDARAAVEALRCYDAPDLLAGCTFARSEGLAPRAAFTELGFPSYGHHCLHDEPFLGYAGAAALAGRLFSSLRACR